MCNKAFNGTLALLNDVCLDHEEKNSNILNGGFLNDHSELLQDVFHMGMLALWHLFRFTGSDQLQDIMTQR